MELGTGGSGGRASREGNTVRGMEGSREGRVRLGGEAAGKHGAGNSVSSWDTLFFFFERRGEKCVSRQAGLAWRSRYRPHAK